MKRRRIRLLLLLFLLAIPVVAIVALLSSLNRPRAVLDIAPGRGIPLIAFSPDGEQLAANDSYSCHLEIWQLNPASLSREFPVCFLELNERNLWPHLLQGMMFMPDGQSLLIDISDNRENPRIEQWSVQTGEIERAYGEIDALVAVSKDGSRMALMRSWTDISIVDISSEEALASFAEHEVRVTCISFSHDGAQVISGDETGNVIVWSATTGEELYRLIGHSSIVTSCEFSPDDTRILTGGYDKTAREWSAGNGREVQRYEYISWVLDADYNYDGSLMAMAIFVSDIISIRDSISGEVVCEIEHSLPHHGDLNNIVFSPVDNRLASVAGNNVVVWENLCGH